MTREEAIITLEHYLDYWKMISDGEAFPIDDDIEALQMAIEALKAEQDMDSAYAHGYTAAEAKFYEWKKTHGQNKWVPCSERLPAENGNYLVTAIWDGKLDVDMDYFQFGCMWDDYGDNVIAWQELPEPYREVD